MRLQEACPKTWTIVVVPSVNHERVCVSVRNTDTDKYHRLELPVEGFHVERALEAVWAGLPPSIAPH